MCLTQNLKQLALCVAILVPMPAMADEGEALYKRMCTSCHGHEGEGRRGLGPSLAESRIVKGELSKFIDVVSNGREGTLMVAFKRNLPAEDLIAIMQYVRTRFGGDTAVKITADDL